jgi:hypothetical protein
MKTLLLDNTLWDLCLDAAGNIAVAQEPYALAQDVASAIKLFLGELWYNSAPGVPYFQQILGKAPPIQLFKEQMVRAALTVPGVVSANCVIESFQDRTVKGAVTFTAEDGTTATVAIQS